MTTFHQPDEEKQYYETKASESEFLTWYRQQDLPKYETPSVTVDIVSLCYNREEDALKLLLIKRNTHPFQYSWALPGGFVNSNEATEESCIRETKEETGVTISEENIEQLYTFSTPGRDPRGWVITVSYLAFIGEEPLTPGDDAKEAVWFHLERKDSALILTSSAGKIILDLQGAAVSDGDHLAFDHQQIVLKAFRRILRKMYHEPAILQVLGPSFTITEARKVFAKILGIDYRTIDHSNFKKMLLPALNEIGEHASGIGRPSKVYELKPLKRS